jgi:AAA domain
MTIPLPDPAGPITDVVDTDAAHTLGLRRVSQLFAAPPPDPLVADWIDRSELFLLVGRSGSGKSLCAIDLACSIATATAWLHRLPVRTGPVVYVVAEGRNSIAPRVRAWCRARSVKPEALEANLYFATGLANLGAAEWVQALIDITDELGAVLVVIDTLAQASPGKDENSARDMGVVIHAAQTLLLRASRPAVGILHHLGKEQSKGARGSTAIPAACDVTLSLSGPARALTLTTDKQRNHEAPDAVTIAIAGSPPYLQPIRWSLAEIIHAGLATLPDGLLSADRSGMARAWAITALPPWQAANSKLTLTPSREAIGKAFGDLISAASVNLTDGVYRLNSNTKPVPSVNFTTPPVDLLSSPAPSASTTSPSIESGEVDAGQVDGAFGEPDLAVGKGSDTRNSNGAAPPEVDEDYLTELVRVTPA